MRGKERTELSFSHFAELSPFVPNQAAKNGRSSCIVTETPLFEAPDKLVAFFFSFLQTFLALIKTYCPRWLNSVAKVVC